MPDWGYDMMVTPTCSSVASVRGEEEDRVSHVLFKGTKIRFKQPFLACDGSTPGNAEAFALLDAIRNMGLPAGAHIPIGGAVGTS